MSKTYQLKKYLSLIFGIMILAAMGILIIGAPLFTSYDPLEQRPLERLQRPTGYHILGTDRFGRDVFSRTLYGGRITLSASVLALGIALFIGLFIGMFSGMFNGSIFDIVIMRLMDVLLAFPFMVLAMVIASLFGTNFFHLISAVIAVWWVPFARLTRSIVLHARNETSVSAAKVLGATDWLIIYQEMLPRAIGPVLILATFELANLILSISALSFLGLGAQPPSPEWGSMLSDGRDHFMQAPHILLGPSFFIVLTVLALNLIGEGMRDWLEPYEIIEL